MKNADSIRCASPAIGRWGWRGLAAGLLFLTACGVMTAKAGNWPQFRGPGSAGISEDKGFPIEWSESKNLKWKTALPGPGSSSPIVWGDRVYITCYSGYGAGRGGSMSKLKRHLLCLGRDSGKIIWEQTVASTVREDTYSGRGIVEHGYASHTPVTDGERIYAFFGKTGAVAFDMEGKKLWQTSLGTQSGNRRWGSSASPVLYKDLVIVNAADESRAVYGLDKKTGKVKWTAPSDQLELTYGSPVIADANGPKPELLLALPEEIWSLNPADGKARWYAGTKLAGNISPTVVVDADNVYAFGGYPRVGSVAVRRKGKGDVTDTHVAWSSLIGPYVPTPVLCEGRLYWVGHRGMACCLEAKTGKTVFETRLEDPGKGCYAATVMADGRLYSVTRTRGTAVWKPGAAFQEVSRNRFESDASDFNAAPALSNGAIFLRSNRFLYCVEKQK